MSVATETTVGQRFLNYASASRYCGMSAQTLRRLVEAGKVKTYHPAGRVVVFDARKLDEYVRAAASTPAR